MKSIFTEYVKPVATGVLIGITVALIFCAGFFLREILQVQTMVFGSNDFPLVTQVKALIGEYYLREVPSDTEQQYAAIRGILAELGDNYTFFIEPYVAKSESEVLAGRYGGIGVQVQRSADGKFLLFPLEDSPALTAGIENGDVLLKVNGEEVPLSTHQDRVDQMMRGEVKDGNGVELTLLKADGSEQTLFILFAEIKVPSVFWRILDEAPTIGYMRIIRFTNRTPEEVREGLARLQEGQISALVLDLRNNGGGLLQESLDVAKEFINGGIIVYERNNKTEKEYTVETGGMFTDLPMVVLVNNGTASASELLAGAILDRERGILIGQTTYGKGTIQQIFALADTSSVHITSAEWLTPNRRIIDKDGLAPTIITQTDETGRDVELSEAILYLQGQP